VFPKREPRKNISILGLEINQFPWPNVVLSLSGPTFLSPSFPFFLSCSLYLHPPLQSLNTGLILPGERGGWSRQISSSYQPKGGR
jgi:hypothetical protein